MLNFYALKIILNYLVKFLMTKESIKMKRNLLGLMVPVFGFALIAGTGFSAWYFSESGSTISHSATNSGSIE